jgi:hypothetical protein
LVSDWASSLFCASSSLPIRLELGFQRLDAAFQALVLLADLRLLLLKLAGLLAARFGARSHQPLLPGDDFGRRPDRSQRDLQQFRDRS